MSFGIDEFTDNFISQIRKGKEQNGIFDKGASVRGEGGIFQMGTNKTERPERLAEKLRRIRLKLGLSQRKMGEALAQYGVRRDQSSVRAYENDDRVPPHLIALAYAKLAKVSLDLLIDDEKELPKGFRIS